MKDNEYEVRISDLLAILLKKSSFIICVMLIFALIGCLYGVKKGRSSTGGGQSRSDIVIAEANLEAASKALARRLEIEIPAAEERVDKARQLVDKRQAYFDNSLYYAIDPLHCGVSRLTFSFRASDESGDAGAADFGREQADLTAVFAELFDEQSKELKDFGTILNTDADAQFIRELLSLSFVSDRSVEITVRAGDAKIAENLAEYLYGVLDKGMQEREEDFRSEVLSRSTGYETDLLMQENHRNMENGLLLAEQSLKDANDELQRLKEEIELLEDGVTEAKSAVKSANRNADKPVITNTKTLLRYGIIMLLLGLVVSAVIVIFAALTGDSLQNRNTVRNVCDFPILGVIPAQKKRMFDKSIRRLEGDPETDFDSAAKVSSQNLLSVAGKRSVLLISSLGDEELDLLKPYIDRRFPVCGDILRRAEAVKQLESSESVVIVEKRGKTLMNQLDTEISLAKALNKNILGIILL